MFDHHKEQHFEDELKKFGLSIRNARTFHARKANGANQLSRKGLTRRLTSRSCEKKKN